MCSPVALLFIIRSFQIERGRRGGCQNLLLGLLEVVWVKHNETSVMGGASVITPMTLIHHSPAHTSPATSRSLVYLHNGPCDQILYREIQMDVIQFISFRTRYCFKCWFWYKFEYYTSFQYLILRIPSTLILLFN